MEATPAFESDGAGAKIHKWGADELPIVDQCTCLGAEISKDRSWDTHTAKVIGKGRAHVGKMDVILTDSHLETRIKICILMNVVPEAGICGRSISRNAKRVKPAGSSTDDSS